MEWMHIHALKHSRSLTQVGAMPARAMGSTVVSVAAAEVALHQQTVDDLAATDDFKWRLQPLLDGEAVLEDRDGAIRQMMKLMEALDDSEDTRNVWTNADFDEKDIEASLT